MLEIEFTNRMKHDAKLMKKRGKDMNKLVTVLDLLAAQTILSAQYHDNQLSGTMNDFRECHIEPDWLLFIKFSRTS